MKKLWILIVLGIGVNISGMSIDGAPAGIQNKESEVTLLEIAAVEGILLDIFTLWHADVRERLFEQKNDLENATWDDYKLLKKRLESLKHQASVFEKAGMLTRASLFTELCEYYEQLHHHRVHFLANSLKAQIHKVRSAL